MNKVRWGILSTAKIGREKVIPGIQSSEFCEVVAIASRNLANAQSVADKLAIPNAYGSYEELLSSDEIDALYIPLPNQLHVPWAIKAIEANKHVLCEKPIALSTDQARELVQAANGKPHLKVMEAFMYRFHPQWGYAKLMVRGGKIGRLKTIHSFFSYYNDDPHNIRNQKDAGGGGMMDIGCYCVSLSRFIFDNEPNSVLGKVELDERYDVDQMASGILNFSEGTATFTCSTQLTPFQRVNIYGTSGSIEIAIPFNAPPDVATRAWFHSASGHEEVIFDVVNQYKLQADLFSQAILNNTVVPTPLKDAVNNMKVIEAIFESSDKKQWITL